MMTKPSVLVVDDDSSVQHALAEVLKQEGCEVFLAGRGEAGIMIMEQNLLDLIITDLNMPGLGGMELLYRAKAKFPDLPVVILTGFGTVQNAVEAMKKGAFDYILKPSSPEIIRHIVKRTFAAKQNDRTFPVKMSEGQAVTRDLVTQNQGMRELLRIASNVAGSRATILLQGESGTGKELLARFIHDHSDRKKNTFLGINCAALPEGLLESELFGHEKGAFTGAVSRKMGKFELADKGTLLLDEISEMPLQLQAKLLRVLQENEIDRVGGKSPVRIDVRVIATTNRDIKAMVHEGLFREDLFYRLNVIPLRILSLRERKDDIPLLCQFFIRRFAGRYDRPVKSISAEALNYIMSREWKGNIRELENFMERAVLLCNGTDIGTADMLLNTDEIVSLPASEDTGGRPTLKTAEKEMILQILNQNNGNRTHAAKALGISVRTLRNKLQEYRAAGWVEPKTAQGGSS